MKSRKNEPKVLSLESRMRHARILYEQLELRLAETKAEIKEIESELRKAKGESPDDFLFFWNDVNPVTEK